MSYSFLVNGISGLCHHLSLFLAASFLWISQTVLASNNDDDNDAASAVGRGRVNSGVHHTSLPFLAGTNISSVALHSFVFFRELSLVDRNLIRHMEAMTALAQQTGNPELFRQAHAASYSGLALSQLEQLVDRNALEGALDPTKAPGQAYFELKTQLLDTSVREVNYSNSGLLLCPPLGDATHLVGLDLSGNQLKAAPVVIGLTQLEILILKNNKLTVAPDVTGLMKLRWLFLSNNQLTAAPDLTGLMNLSRLTLANNQLTSPPDLTGLTKLEHLTLANNQLTSPPDLTGLTKLERLYLNNNQLTVPPYVTGLTKLTSLYLNGNQITVAPDVTGLMQLESLFLDTNLCGDPNLLKTLRVLNREKVGFSWCALLSCSKDALGNTIYTHRRSLST